MEFAAISTYKAVYIWKMKKKLLTKIQLKTG